MKGLLETLIDITGNGIEVRITNDPDAFECALNFNLRKTVSNKGHLLTNEITIDMGEVLRARTGAGEEVALRLATAAIEIQ